MRMNPRARPDYNSSPGYSTNKATRTARRDVGKPTECTNQPADETGREAKLLGHAATKGLGKASPRLTRCLPSSPRLPPSPPHLSPRRRRRPPAGSQAPPPSLTRPRPHGPDAEQRRFCGDELAGEAGAGRAGRQPARVGGVGGAGAGARRGPAGAGEQVRAVRGRVLLERGAGVPAGARGHAHRGRVQPGQPPRPNLRGRLHRRHQPQRGRPRPVRPRRLQVRRPPRRLLGAPRPHHAQPPGQRCWDPVQIRDLLLHPGAGQGGKRIPREAAESSEPEDCY